MPLDPTLNSPVRFLAEGGTETEIMFRHGFEFPHFAVFELLKDAKAKATLADMFKRYLDVVAEGGFGALMSGLDYRASPDWGALLGYSPEGLRDVQANCIGFLRDVAAPYQDQLADILIVGIAGPRGDAYELNQTITEAQAEDYHAVQFETLKALDVDMVWGATLNNVPEAVGMARAASKIGLPICISFTLTSEHRLRAGPTLREAVLSTDKIAAEHRPFGYGINCSHPLEFAPALEPGDWFQRVRNIRPNAAAMDKIALCKLNHLEDGDPIELAGQLGELSREHKHIDLWGGCCGTWDTHLRALTKTISPAKAAV